MRFLLFLALFNIKTIFLKVIFYLIKTYLKPS